MKNDIHHSFLTGSRGIHVDIFICRFHLHLLGVQILILVSCLLLPFAVLLRMEWLWLFLAVVGQ